MTVRVSRAINVRRSYSDVAAFVTDPHRVLDTIPGFARFAYIGEVEDGEEWDVFLEVGTLHVGGRVLVTWPSPNRLEWRSLRGTRQRLVMDVEPLGDHARLTMTLSYGLSGLVLSRISELLARGLVSRHVEAGLQQVRHHLEYGDFEVAPEQARRSGGGSRVSDFNATWLAARWKPSTIASRVSERRLATVRSTRSAWSEPSAASVRVWRPGSTRSCRIRVSSSASASMWVRTAVFASTMASIGVPRSRVSTARSVSGSTS
jgi:carbon monoxide dehydrogenase subunit G